MKTLISSTEGLLFVILLMVAFSLWLQRYKVFRSLGPVLTVVIIGIVLSNTHVVPISHDLYSSISTYCVQAGISICLLSMNVTELKKLNRQPVIALGEFVGSAFMMTLYVFLMLIGCTVLHFLIRRLFKIKYEYVLLSMVGCIVDGPTASLTAAGGNWKSLINVGLIMGVIAGACGNYVGIFVAYVVKAICGL